MLWYTIPLVILGNGSAITVPYSHLVWFLECFIIPIFLLTFFKDIFEKYSWESLVVIAGTIAAFITIFLINNPEINLWMRGSVIVDSLDTTGKEWSFRGYTFAESSAFGYGVIQGIFFAICLFSLKKSNLYFIPLIPLLTSILFNARVGFVVVIISLILMLVYKRIKIKGLIATGVLIFITVLFYNNSAFINENKTTIEWGMTFFDETFSFLSAGDTSNSTFGALAGTMLFFPKTFFGLIFGEGRTVFAQQSMDSDIGYVNQIFTGGLIYIGIMLFFLWYMYKRNLKYATDKLYPILFFLTIITVNFKGSVFFMSHSFFRLFILYYIYCIFIAEEKINKPNEDTMNIAES